MFFEKMHTKQKYNAGSFYFFNLTVIFYVRKVRRYYVSGLPWTYETEQVQPYLYNGKEFVEMGGYDVTDLGNRGLYHAINRFTSIDRFCEKFPWQSPYVVAGNNPIKFVDINGDSIYMKNIYDNHRDIYDKIINDLSAETGYTYKLTDSGMLVYDTNDDGSAKISTKDGKEIGSAEARDIMRNAIGHAETVQVSISSSGKSHSELGGLQISLGTNEINRYINGTKNMDKRTLGYGMIFMHEILHTRVGGSLTDTEGYGNTGGVVDRMNIVRRQLGENWGQRLSYTAMELTSPMFSGKYYPFDNLSKAYLRNGLPPDSKSKYIQF